MPDRPIFSQKLLEKEDAKNPAALERIAIAKRRVQSVLDREIVAHQKTLEQKTGGHYVSAGSGKCPANQKELVENLGIGLSNLNLIFNPEVIVLGGSIYLSCLSKQKKQLEQIIKKHSLAKQSPKLLDASSKTSVARGVVHLLNK